jgi:Ni,Fe-hydrogenase III large subunit
VPGGVAVDLDAAGRGRRFARSSRDSRRFPPLVELYDNTASLQDRTVGTGILKPSSRASSAPAAMSAAPRARLRRAQGSAIRPTTLAFEVPVLDRGRRQRPRLDPHPRGRAEPVADRADPRPLPTARCGDVPAARRRGAWRWSRASAATCSPGCGSASDGAIERCHLRDPSWFQWPLLEAAIEGNIVADFPLCNKSFNCSYSGHDL